MTLLQKLFLSLFISMIISPNGLRDRLKRIFEKDPSLKDLKHGEINKAYTETDDDLLDLTESKEDNIEADTMEKVNKDSAFVYDLIDLSIPDQPTRETVQQTKSSHSRGGVMLVPMNPYQLEVARKPLKGNDKYQHKEQQKERYRKYMEQMKKGNDKYQHKEQQKERYRKYIEQMKETKAQQSQQHSQKYNSLSDYEIESIGKDVDKEYKDDNELFVLLITDIDDKFEKYKRENQDRPILGRSINKFIEYVNEKDHQLQRKYDDRMRKIYEFLADILSDVKKVTFRWDEHDTTISYHISIYECEQIQNDIDRNNCYELLCAMNKHGVAVFAYVLLMLEL